MRVKSNCVKLTLLLKLSVLFVGLGISIDGLGQSNFTSKTIGVGVVVADLERSLDFYVKRLTQMKIPFLGSTPTPLNANAHFVLVQDPDGTFIELIGPLD